MGETFAKSPEEAASSSLEKKHTFSSASSGVKLWKTLFIIVTLALVAIGGFYAYGFYQDTLEKSYDAGRIHGQFDIVNIIITNLNQSKMTIAKWVRNENGTIVNFNIGVPPSSGGVQ